MRLIDVDTLKFVEFITDEVPPYAILSHRWEGEEVSYQEFINGTGVNKAGYRKIAAFCERAKNDGYQLAWCDTCCINKESSADLSESINSMFKWYQKSGRCYVYLSDVHEDHVGDDFKGSQWFTRGWTLQELLAPRDLIFYNHEWQAIGSRVDTLATVSQGTGIDDYAFEVSTFESFSIAQRMSWTAKRTTTRGEDWAYSLLGLFDVNMPLLYGEGAIKAFTRLQEEIMKRSRDQSIFAWELLNPANSMSGLLAESPHHFANCSEVSHLDVDVLPLLSEASMQRRLSMVTPYSMTNLGLSIELLMVPYAQDIYLATLDCTHTNLLEDEVSMPTRISIFISIVPWVMNSFTRVTLNGVDRMTITPRNLYRSQYVRCYIYSNSNYLRYDASSPEKLFSLDLSQLTDLYGFYIESLPPLEHNHREPTTFIQDRALFTRSKWNPNEMIVDLAEGEFGTAGTLYMPSRKPSRINLGFDWQFRPKIQIWNEDLDNDAHRITHPDDSWMEGEDNKAVYTGSLLEGLDVVISYGKFERKLHIHIERRVIKIQGSLKRAWVVAIQPTVVSKPSQRAQKL